MDEKTDSRLRTIRRTYHEKLLKYPNVVGMMVSTKRVRAKTQANPVSPSSSRRSFQKTSCGLKTCALSR